MSAEPASPSDFETQVTALRKDERWVALPGLLLAYALLAALLVLPAFVQGAWIFALVWPLIGVLQYRIVISGHEAVHFTLVPHKGLNELLGVFGQSIVGVNFAAYRLQHLDHHRAKDLESDPDGHIYGGIIRTPRGWRRTLVWTLGTFVEILVKIRQKGTGGYGTHRKQSDKQVAQRRRHTAYVILAQLSLMGIGAAVLAAHRGVDLLALSPLSLSGALTWALHLVGGYALLWTGPLFTVAVFLNRSRILIEHGLAMIMEREMSEEFGGRRIPTVDIVPNALERVVFAPFLFNYHCCHHLFMAVPHYNLPQLRALCREYGVSGYHEVPGSYLSALRRTMST
ncbi:MAG: fatty acid desaturase [Alphaproteobacteria bacterium]|nr:fatty acid desaturase [Alphaproteobacteria bacterium]MCB9796353.1 fatty acid desaturase [Alphaproteobacteria bacterium]